VTSARSAAGISISSLHWSVCCDAIRLPGGEMLIIDMRNDASNEAIDGTVDEMKLGA